MATLAASAYSSHHSPYLPQSNRTVTSTSVSQAQPVSHQQPQQETNLAEEGFTTLFCRALYDYQAQDASALSFRRNDIIEVLTQQPSGWWDGLLGEERGWFPSNYVTIISDEEAESAFAGSELAASDGTMTDLPPDGGIVDMSHAMLRASSQAENEDWLHNDSSLGDASHVPQPSSRPETSSDFWMPQVTADGQIYYLNTQTGQRSRDLPQEADDDVSDSDLVGLTSQSSSRSGTSAGLAFGAPDPVESSVVRDQDAVGFGLPRKTGTPEPWIKRLADDGMSYYYYNKNDGSIQWTRPETRPTGNQLGAPSSSQPTRDLARVSVYSDDSDVLDYMPSARQKMLNDRQQQHRSPSPADNTLVETTSAERIASALQSALTPSPPQLVTELSAITKDAIQAVINNIQLNGPARRVEDDQKMDELIHGAVLAVRNLLYVSAIPTSQIPANVLPREVRDTPVQQSQSPLKSAQRKVTATLSRLVLSARAMQYDSGSPMSDTLNRIEVDAEELERAVLSFVLEVQRSHHTESNPPKRLRGVFSTNNIGPGLVGAGAAGNWKGFGLVALDDPEPAPRKLLGPELIFEMKGYLSDLENHFSRLVHLSQVSDESSSAVEQVRLYGRELVSQIASFLSFAGDIHVARHVDIDGIRYEGTSHSNDPYFNTVEKARLLVRTLETVAQSLYDDLAVFLLTVQSVRDSELGLYRQERDGAYDHLDTLITSLSSNLAFMIQTLDSLLSIGHDQAEMSQGDYNGSIEWRMSRISVRPIQQSNGRSSYDNPDVVDMELAFGSPSKTVRASRAGDIGNPTHRRNYTKGSQSNSISSSQGFRESDAATADETLIADDHVDSYVPLGANNDASPLFDDDPIVKPPPRPAGSNKLTQLLGDEYADKIAADSQPWYLRPNYNASEIIIEPDNSVRGGTVSALVERLTAHEHAADTSFSMAFLMTYKSFTTPDELFDLLVSRFRIQPPPNLTPAERDEWAKLKQHVIQIRVLNTFKSMVVDDDVLEKEDMHILDRMKEFVTSEDVFHFAAAKQLLTLIERAQRSADGTVKTMINTFQVPPPAPIMPKTTKKLKLADVEPLELARQLTIMESQLYQKIRPMECLQRAREQRTENMDNIAIVIQTSNRIADWVAELVLSKEDSRKRANTVKHLISVADRCRALNNFSSMIAITSGLNTPPIRRLKRTWELVNQRSMAQFGACEMTIDSNKNFNKYRQLMASVTPPCVPFIGVFLSTLQFIQDGNPDELPGGLVNFRKRQKASEVISDIKRWQTQPFNFQPIPAILGYIEESLNQFNDTRASSEHFWNLSLEREPREREDEKMARLLQESGFL